MRSERWIGFVLLLGAAACGGRAEAEATNATVITSDSLTFDYKRSIAMFEGNVAVSDPQMRMTAERLNVVFDSTNSVKSVVAIGRVRLWQAEKTANCERAVYVAKTGEIILRGNATVQRAKDAVRGDQIIFYLNDDRMTCTPGHLTVFPEADDLSGLDGRLRP
jgi:lipopolysaccharide export system protein LptA